MESKQHASKQPINQRICLKGNKIVYIGLNENNNIIYQIFVDATKAVIRGKYLALNAYIILEEKNF